MVSHNSKELSTLTSLQFFSIVDISFCQGMEKVNFSGGEPFIKDRGRYLGELVRYCKKELCLPSVTIVSNGSLITEEWFEQNGKNEHIFLYM